MKLYPMLGRPALDVLSGFDRERAHHLALFVLRMSGVFPLQPILSYLTYVRNEKKVFGIAFPNPVGAAAGFDKYAQALDGVAAFGFGFAEVGTVTPRPQSGNPRPRLFRLSEDGAVINRMGFNNDGVVQMERQLAAYQSRRIPIGVNIGKGKDTPLESAAEDYEKCITALYLHADYFTINISSPNTKDLRLLHEKKRLEALLDRVQKKVRECSGSEDPKPLLLKISPDLSARGLDDLLSVCSSRVQGLVICNTTVDRPEYLRSLHRSESGGLSGLPLKERALLLVKFVHRALPGMPIVGVGGIASAEDAIRMFDAGASLVQLYTGLVFEGPLLAHRVNRALRERVV